MIFGARAVCTGSHRPCRRATAPRVRRRPPAKPKCPPRRFPACGRRGFRLETRQIPGTYTPGGTREANRKAAPPTGEPMSRYIGARVRNLDAPLLLTGRARFVDDVKLPGMLHAAFLRSPHAHARIVGVDVEAARRLPGVAPVPPGGGRRPAP